MPRTAGASTAGRLVVAVDNRTGQAAVPPGTSVWLQVVSLFPPTFRNRPNGLRPDLVAKIAGIAPKILRFPGGNYVEGTTELGPYVQDALDLVEYVTGPVTSTWGARRAAGGHPDPFGMPYLEIGNEDFLNGGTQSYDDYRYPMFYDALKAARAWSATPTSST